MTPPEPNSALEGLRELPLPAPFSYAPEAVGWYILAALLLMGFTALAIRWWRRWNANRYRRAALAELAALESEQNYGGLPALVKRTVLAAAPRESAASLTGQAWLEFLDATDGSTAFTAGPGRLLPDLAYGQPQLAESDATELLALVRRWIRRHRAGI